MYSSLCIPIKLPGCLNYSVCRLQFSQFITFITRHVCIANKLHMLYMALVFLHSNSYLNHCSAIVYFFTFHHKAFAIKMITCVQIQRLSLVMAMFVEMGPVSLELAVME